MTHQTIPLYDNDDRVTLTMYIRSDVHDPNAKKRPAVIVFPGGGLSFLSEREAEPIALAFLAAGMNTFVLRYSIGEFGNYPLPLLDASVAVAYVRKNSEILGVDPDSIYVVGFSAGGYIAAMLGVRWHEAFITEELELKYGMNKPDGIILAYPVITAGEFSHKGTIENSIGKFHTSAELYEHSLENLVSEKTPPVFLWHTADDPTVPVENSLLFASALSQSGVPFELHIYPHGTHGLSLATEETSGGNKALENKRISEWINLASEWIKEN